MNCRIFSTRLPQLILCAFLLVVAQFATAQQNTLTVPNNQNQWAGIITAAGVPLSVSVDNGTLPQSSLMINTFTQPNGLMGAVHSLVGLPGGNRTLEVRDVVEVSPNATTAGACPGNSGLYITGISKMVSATGASTLGNMFVARLLANGTVCWYYEHANTSTTIGEWGVAVVAMPNGDVMAVGNTSNPQMGATSVIGARFTSVGGVVWSNYYNCNCTVAVGSTNTVPYTQGCQLVSRELA